MGVKYAYVTTFNGYDIFFHISTLLPYKASDSQQVCVRARAQMSVFVCVPRLP